MLEKLRKFLIRKLITVNEAYVLYWGIDFRIDQLEKNKVTDKHIDAFNCDLDIKLLRNFQRIFNENKYK